MNRGDLLGIHMLLNRSTYDSEDSEFLRFLLDLLILDPSQSGLGNNCDFLGKALKINLWEPGISRRKKGEWGVGNGWFLTTSDSSEFWKSWPVSLITSAVIDKRIRYFPPSLPWYYSKMLFCSFAFLYFARPLETFRNPKTSTKSCFIAHRNWYLIESDNSW